jgi:hypothetical protein
MYVNISCKDWFSAALGSFLALGTGCGSDSPDQPWTSRESEPGQGVPAASPAASGTSDMMNPSTTEPESAPALQGTRSTEMAAVETLLPAPAAAPAPAAVADMPAMVSVTDPGKIEAGGDSKCPLAAAALCDGFEGPAPGQMGSAFTFAPEAGATAVVDATKAYRGKNSVHMKTNTGGAFITETQTFTGTTAASNNEMWGRIFIWFQTAANPQSHDVFITLEDPASTAASAQLHLAGGSRGMLAAQIRTTTDVYRPAIAAAQASPTAVKFPLATPAWQCWEWHTTAANTIEFYIDGALYAPMSVTAADKWPMPVFKKLSLGFLQFGGTPATELWIDEVALGTARVGCGN